MREIKLTAEGLMGNGIFGKIHFLSVSPIAVVIC